MIESALALLRAPAPGAAARAVRTFVGCVSVMAVIAIADYHTGYDLRLAILYLAPVALATWSLGRPWGIGFAFVAVFTWLLMYESSHPYSDAFYFYWEGVVYLGVFVIFAVLLARLRDALARSDERFTTVLEGLDAVVLVEDARDGVLLYGNRRFRELFGALPSTLRGSGELLDDTSGRWYLAQTRPLRWVDGREALLRVLADVSEERRARELIAKHREAAHRTARLVALGEFASAIAHELNQPLAAIATYNDACLMLLRRGGGGQGELATAMSKCRDQAARAGAIIQRLREVLRQPVPERSRQPLNDIARTAIELARSQAEEAGVSLSLDLAPDGPVVRTDRLLVEQVALNLVRNAIEAVQGLPAERRRVRLATGRGAAGSATLEVSDRGPGLPAEVGERLFQPFVSTKPDGLGLGLSICRSVIESLGGGIRARAAEGAGACFEFWLPLEGS